MIPCAKREEDVRWLCSGITKPMARSNLLHYLHTSANIRYDSSTAVDGNKAKEATTHPGISDLLYTEYWLLLYGGGYCVLHASVVSRGGGGGKERQATTYLDVRLVIPDFQETRVEAAEFVDLLLVLVPDLISIGRHSRSQEDKTKHTSSCREQTQSSTTESRFDTRKQAHETGKQP